MSNLKIAAMLQVGPLDSMGYQYNHDITIECLHAFFDKVYIASSTPKLTELPEHLQYDNVELLSTPSTWLQHNTDGLPIFNLTKPIPGLNHVLKKAIKDGYCDLALKVELFQYIDQKNFAALRAYCDQIIESDHLFGYRYKALQTRQYIAHPTMCHPALFNLRHDRILSIHIGTDKIEHGEQVVHAKRGLFLDAPYFITDFFPPILCEKDFLDKYEYYLKPIWDYYNCNKDMDWPSYEKKQLHKAMQSPINPNATLSEWGWRMMKSIPHDSCVHEWDMKAILGQPLQSQPSIRTRLINKMKSIAGKMNLIKSQDNKS